MSLEVHELGSNFEYNNKITMMTMMTSFIEIEDALSWRRGVWMHAVVCFMHSKVLVWNPTVGEPHEATVELSNLTFAVLTFFPLSRAYTSHTILYPLYLSYYPLSLIPPILLLCS